MCCDILPVLPRVVVFHYFWLWCSVVEQKTRLYSTNLHYASTSHLIHSTFPISSPLISHSPSETKKPITVQEVDHKSVLGKVFQPSLGRLETFTIAANHAFPSSGFPARLPLLTLNHSDIWFPFSEVYSALNLNGMQHSDVAAWIMVDKVTLGQVFSEYFGFPCQSSFHQILHPHNHPGQVQ
jgi:hypothetical protein